MIRRALLNWRFKQIWIQIRIKCFIEYAAIYQNEKKKKTIENHTIFYCLAAGSVNKWHAACKWTFLCFANSKKKKMWTKSWQRLNTVIVNKWKWHMVQIGWLNETLICVIHPNQKRCHNICRVIWLRCNYNGKNGEKKNRRRHLVEMWFNIDKSM